MEYDDNADGFFGMYQQCFQFKRFFSNAENQNCASAVVIAVNLRAGNFPAYFPGVHECEGYSFFNNGYTEKCSDQQCITYQHIELCLQFFFLLEADQYGFITSTVQS